MKNKCQIGATLPHVGWNNLIATENSLSYYNVDNLSQYFVHSFVAQNVPEHYVLHYCEYSQAKFAASVKSGLTVGFQFHPERSGLNGLRLLSSTIIDLISETKFSSN